MSTKRLRPLVDALRGKRVQEAMNALRFVPGPAALRISMVLKSAVSNAENNMMMSASRLKVVGATVDGGPVIKRFRARARGRVGSVHRPTSHITIVVDEVE